MSFIYRYYFIYSFNIYLLSTFYVQGMVLCAEETVQNTAKVTDLMEFSLVMTNSLILSVRTLLSP